MVVNIALLWGEQKKYTTINEYHLTTMKINQSWKKKSLLVYHHVNTIGTRVTESIVLGNYLHTHK